MSILSFLRNIFGKPIEWKVIKLKKTGQYLIKINSDDKEVIKAFMKKFNEAKERGENIFVPIDVEAKEIKIKDFKGAIKNNGDKRNYE